MTAIAAHAREVWPYECCGLLIGSAAMIEAVYRAGNEHEQRATRYLVCAEDHFAAIRLARAQALDVVGAYHSHPAGRARPSPTDRDEAHAGLIYLIAGARRLRRASWTLGRVGNRRAFRRAARSARRASRQARSVEACGHWVAAWRLVEGNFVQVPLVRLA